MISACYNYVNKDARMVRAIGRVIKTLGGVSMNVSISGVYAIVNRVNGNKYIGSSKDVAHRFKTHVILLNNKKHHSNHLQHAWNYYGSVNFDFVVIEECEVCVLIEREQFYIDTQNPMYNVCAMAGTRKNTKHSEETKQKLRNANIGKKASDETKMKMSESRKGKASYKRTVETIQKMVNSRAGWKHTDESKQKISESRKGIPLSQKNKDGISNAMIGNTNTLGKRWKWKKNKDD